MNSARVCFAVSSNSRRANQPIVLAVNEERGRLYCFRLPRHLAAGVSERNCSHRFEHVGAVSEVRDQHV